MSVRVVESQMLKVPLHFALLHGHHRPVHEFGRQTAPHYDWYGLDIEHKESTAEAAQEVAGRCRKAQMTKPACQQVAERQIDQSRSSEETCPSVETPIEELVSPRSLKKLACCDHFRTPQPAADLAAPLRPSSGDPGAAGP
jgi:hypothetical protein